MHLLHDSIADTPIVQLQHIGHVSSNSGRRGKTSGQPSRQQKVRCTMAYVNSTRTAQSFLFDRIGALATAVGAALQRRRVYSQTLSELRALNARELADLGIAASMITEIAREAAYGK